MDTPVIRLASKSGDFKKTEDFLIHAKKPVKRSILNEYGRKGVAALSSMTPVDTGKTAASWSYRVVESSNGAAIEFHNSNLSQGWANVALLLQYGHGTRQGAWVEGRDYINPALRPVFDSLAQAVWREVTSK